MKKYLIFDTETLEIINVETRPDNEPYEPSGNLDSIEIDENSYASEYYFKNSKLTKRPKSQVMNTFGMVLNGLLMNY